MAVYGACGTDPRKIVQDGPAPGSVHQRISLQLTLQVGQYFKGKSCSVFSAPFDVRLPVPSAGKDTTVVQPDLCIICNENNIDTRGCNGAPDLVVEILSPGNAKHEMATKFKLYEESGVQEYWIVQPEEKTILVYTLQNGRYVGLRPVAEGMGVTSPLFPELVVKADEVFEGT